MKLVIDTFEYSTKHVPKYNPISVSGYHIREAGSTALQELAFTLRDGVEYVQYGIDRGMDVDEFVPRLSFFFNAHNDFFEEIAKYRAARIVWAKTMKRPFWCEKPANYADAFSHADGGSFADRPAAAEQHRPRRDSGACRSFRRHAVAAHRFVRRSARSADR